MIQIHKTITLSSWLVPFVIFTALDGFVMLTDLRWLGEYGWAVEWANAGLYLSGTILAAACCFLSRPYFAASFRQLARIESFSGQLRLFTSVLWRNLTIGLIGHAVVMAVALLMTSLSGASDSLAWQGFVYPLIPIVTFTAFGTLVGAFAPSIFAAVISLGLAYAVSYGTAASTIQLPLNIGGINVSMVGLGYTTSVLGTYTGWAAVITLVLVIGGVLVIRSRRSGVAGAIFFGALVLAILGPSASGVYFPDRVVVNSDVGQFQCAGSSPEVCLAAGHTRNLALISDGVTRSAKSMLDAGIDLKSVTLRDDLPFRAPKGVGVLLLPGSYLNEANFTEEDFAHALTRPADCDAFYGGADATEQDALLRVSDALGEWIFNSAVDGPSDSNLSREWARDAYRDLQACTVSPSVLEATK